MSRPVPRHNLPVRLTTFIGRERELNEVVGLLSGARLVTLVGAPGVGKTRLALQVAAVIASQFDDGVCFVELAAVAEPALVPETVATALGVQEQVGRSMATTLAEHLAARRLLLVLDNCEHLVLACATLVEDLLRPCADLRILATSREALRTEGETTWRVPSLSTPEWQAGPVSGSDPAVSVQQSDAVRLFVDRARSALPAFTVTDQSALVVGRICQRLDGIPLAIELTAARVGALSLEQIASRLDDHFRLRSGGRRTAFPRHQTLRGAIDWSFDLLDADERALLRRLAVFAGGWTLTAAQAVCGSSDTGHDAATSLRTSGPDVLDLLLQLVDKSLVQVDGKDWAEPRYRLLEMLRQYGLERLGAAGEETAMRRRHLAWCLDLAEQSVVGIRGMDGAIWLNRLTDELDNLRGALAWSLTDPASVSAQVGLRLAGTLFFFWIDSFRLTEGQHWLAQTLAADAAYQGASARDDDPTEVSLATAEQVAPSALADGLGGQPRVAALRGLGALSLNLGSQEEATEYIEEALTLAQASKDRAGEASALLALAAAARPIGDLERAVALAEEGLALYRLVDVPHGLFWAATSLADTLTLLGSYARARTLLEEALTMAQSTGYLWNIAQASRLLGIVAYHEGDLDEAIRLLEDSLVSWSKLQSSIGQSWALWELGHLVLARGNPGRAIRYFTECLELSHASGQRRTVVRCLEGLALGVSAAVGDLGARSDDVARLLGLVASVRQPSDRWASQGWPTTDQAAAAARATLGDDAYARALVAGRGLSVTWAIALGHELGGGSQATVPDEPPDVDVSVSPVSDSGDRLTAREREVAVLVARGLSNRQIAEHLALSWRTVETHVHNILSKLELSSRAQIVIWSIEHGLAVTRRD